MNGCENLEVRSFTTASEVIDEVVRLATLRIIEGLALGESFHIALTGGLAGSAITEKLVMIWNQRPNDFIGLHVWWSDERFLSIFSPERNANSLLLNLDSHPGITVHEAPAREMGITLDRAAEIYQEEISHCEMNLTLLGVGPDGHVASLFPGAWMKNEERGVIAVLDSPKPPAERITFSISKINASKSVWLIALGENKRMVVAEIFSGNLEMPAVSAQGRLETLLFIDQAALPDR